MSGNSIEAKYLTSDWIGTRLTATLATCDTITGTLVGLDIETEALATLSMHPVAHLTTVTANFKHFGHVNIPPEATICAVPAEPTQPSDTPRG